MHKDVEYCQIDLLNPFEIRRHIRDLLNLAEVLDFDAEFTKFLHKLSKKGWGEDEIIAFIEGACLGTKYEHQLPRPIRSRGNWYEYLKNKSRR